MNKFIIKLNSNKILILPPFIHKMLVPAFISCSDVRVVRGESCNPECVSLIPGGEYKIKLMLSLNI